MTRKEEIITASHNEKNYPGGIISDKTSHPIIFQIGAGWADQHTNRETLVDFMQYLNKRGFFRDDLCFDTEHQVDTFIELNKQKNIKLWKK